MYEEKKFAAVRTCKHEKFEKFIERRYITWDEKKTRRFAMDESYCRV